MKYMLETFLLICLSLKSVRVICNAVGVISLVLTAFQIFDLSCILGVSLNVLQKIKVLLMLSSVRD